MFCSNCGAENPKGASYCKNCGQALKVINSPGINSNQIKNHLGNAWERFKKIPNQFKIGGVAFVVVIIIGIMIYTNLSNTVNLNDYLSIESSGYEGYGKVEAKIDWDSIEEKYGDKMKMPNGFGDDLSELNDLFSLFGGSLLEDAIDVTLEDDNALSNGDFVHYTWDVDEDITDGLGVKFKYNDGDYTVSGLESLGTFDAFDGLFIDFLGTSPNGYLEAHTGGDGLPMEYYSIDKATDLSNGDIITVKFDDTEIDDFAANFGVLPESLEKTYTVSGLDEYVTSFSQLDAKHLKTLKKDTEDNIVSTMRKYMYKKYNLDELTYEGYILGKVNEEHKGEVAYNDLILIYSGKVSSPDDSFVTEKVYFPVSYSKVAITQGKIGANKDRKLLGNSSLGNNVSTKGFLTPLLCYSKISEIYGKYYDLEAGGSFEAYKDYKVITEMSEIEDSYKKTLEEEAKEVIQSYAESNYNNDIVLSDISVMGSYLLSLKGTSDTLEEMNRYIIICQGLLSSSKNNFETTTFYYPVEYDGIVKLKGDSDAYAAVEGILGSSYVPKTWYFTHGYAEGVTMYQEIIEENRDLYGYEISDSLKAFGQ